jgi:septin family protein
LPIALSLRELRSYRAEVLGMLQNPSKVLSGKNLPHLDLSLFSFAESIIGELGMEQTQMPLAIVTSRDHEACADRNFLASLGLEGVHNPTQPVRHYKWGVCYPLNREHSDLILLKRLLIGDRVESLYSMLDDSYSRCMTFCQNYEECGKQLQHMIEEATNLGAAYLEYDDNQKAKVALDSAKAAMTTLSEENKFLAERLAAVEREKAKLQEKLNKIAV